MGALAYRSVYLLEHDSTNLLSYHCSECSGNAIFRRFYLRTFDPNRDNVAKNET